ncbi:FAD/NAD(P)-binding domain-containing protein [Cristinia sonorae]|uniref:FAD/NAD(P)-binding domain-containing protein n=1 Tax=Cristinia sonorae TaxID=1940300 RepID=A0A8K0UP17_9AGAR|nr:FAD/NAD(P)-binding domain-containing protein [Cristinia sonorae]
MSIPTQATVLVIGGGPAGSYTSAVLAQEGVDVVCCEAASFPRYHIGESLLASVKAFLKLVDACEKIDNHGFKHKPGSAIKFRADRVEAYTDFVAINPKNGSWNVTRSEFDEILLNHAEEKGAKVFQETRIDSIGWTEGRPRSAQWSSKGQTGTIAFDYVVDCSGRQGVLSTKYLHNRHTNTALKNIATWGYWVGNAGVYGQGTRREGAIYIEGLANGPPGWVWFIPLADKVSVGVVMHEDDNTRLRKEHGESVEAHYLRALARAPNVTQLLKDTTLDLQSSVRMASDYSYSATAYAGEGWRLAGDASAFIDPFFSSGVHLAFNGGLSAAISILAAIRGDVTEERASKYHDKKVSMAYTRFLLVVLAAYKQLHYQDMDVLSDVDTNSFDAAFDLLRPVIQGTGDVDSAHSREVTENELAKTMDFIASVLTTSSAEIAAAKASGKVPEHLFDREGAVLGPAEIARIVKDTGADEVTERALRSINARKPLQLYDPSANFEQEQVLGMVADLRHGQIGLRDVTAASPGPDASSYSFFAPLTRLAQTFSSVFWSR